jgi:hypothetical protein
MNAFTSQPRSFNIVESRTAPSLGIGNLLKILLPGDFASMNEILMILLNLLIPIMFLK